MGLRAICQIPITIPAGSHDENTRLAKFMTNPAGAAIVNAVGPIRQIVKDAAPAERRFLVIRSGAPDEAGAVVQRQKP